MFLRSLIKKEYENQHISLTESELVQIVHIYWKSLSPEMKEHLNYRTRRSWTCNPNRREEEIRQREIQVYVMKDIEREGEIKRSNRKNEKVSYDIPVLGDFGFHSKGTRIIQSERLALGKRIVAAQLSKQNSIIPKDDPYVTSQVDPRLVDSLNEKYKRQSKRLWEAGGFTSESEVSEAFHRYRTINPDGTEQKRNRKGKTQTIEIEDV